MMNNTSNNVSNNSKDDDDNNNKNNNNEDSNGGEKIHCDTLRRTLSTINFGVEEENEAENDKEIDTETNGEKDQSVDKDQSADKEHDTEIGEKCNQSADNEHDTENGEENQCADNERLESRKGVIMPRDVFTMMLFADPLSLEFLYGFLLFWVQLAILFSILTNLTKNSVDGNRLNVPANVGTEVRVAQVIATAIAGVSNKDVTDSLRVLAIGWGPCLQDRFSHATHAKFIFSNMMRIFEGLCVTVASLIFIVQSTNVLEIFMNFAAVEFVAGLDDLGYQLAREGWIGTSMEHFAASIEDVRVGCRTSAWFDGVKPALGIIFLLGLGSCLVPFALKQNAGTILETMACGIVHVSFGDLIFPLSETGDYAFDVETSAANFETFLDYYDDDFIKLSEEGLYWNIVGSNRRLGFGFNSSAPPDLHFVYFSGIYHADFDNLESNRPIYFEDNNHDITAGMFYYCESENAWVFTMRAFIHTGVIPIHTLEWCKHGWLMRSPKTEALFLDEAPSDGWKAWTGFLESVSEFSVTCAECNTDFDCGSSARGTCIDKQCQCKPGIAEGRYCDQERSCDDLLLFEGADEYQQGITYPDDKSTFRTYRNIRTALFEEETMVNIRGRPAYYLNTMLNGEVAHEVIFYTGSRWYDAYFQPWQFPIDVNVTWKAELFRSFHPYWNNVLVTNAHWISEETESYMPTGILDWSGFKESKSTGSYGGFPAMVRVPQRFECYSVDCDKINVCGLTGNCTSRPEYNDTDGYVLRGNQCVCDPRFDGHFCEYPNAAPLVPSEVDDVRSELMTAPATSLVNATTSAPIAAPAAAPFPALTASPSDPRPSELPSTPLPSPTDKTPMPQPVESSAPSGRYCQFC